MGIDLKSFAACLPRANGRYGVAPLTAIAVVAALGMSACGGSSNKTATTTTPTLSPAAAKKAAAATGKAKNSVVSPNWSGYVVTSNTKKSVKFTAVTGTWTVPVAHCTVADAGASSTAWVGIGGFQEKYQDEVGTNSNCDTKGKPHYFAWFELVPYPAYLTFDKNHWSIKWGVSPGDVMTGTVKILNRKKIRLELHNRTRGWIFTRDVDLALQDTTTAEWVVSAPANCIKFDCAQASLSNFGEVKMRNVSATGDGKSGTLRNKNWRVLKVKLVPGKLIVPYLGIDNTVTRTGQANSPAGATPGPPSADGKSFNITWVRVAKRGV